MLINYVLRGRGRPLLLLHGLGCSWRSWQPVLPLLAARRSIVAIDLPGFGRSPPLDLPPTVDRLADAVAQFLEEHDLIGADAAGCSIGGRLVLELSRRGGLIGTGVSLGPLGFWSMGERRLYQWLSRSGLRIARALHLALPAMLHYPWARRVLLAPCSISGQKLSAAYALQELRSYARSAAVLGVLRELDAGTAPLGAPAGTLKRRLVIGWGHCDRLCLPRQAARAMLAFPDAQLHWFERCGHFPHWDVPEETSRLILEATKD